MSCKSYSSKKISTLKELTMKIDHLDTELKTVQPAVIAFFNDVNVLENVLDDLKLKNFKNEDISILTINRKDISKSIFDGVVKGAMTGLAEGGIFCWLISLGVITIPGAGIFIAAGPFISAIAGVALGANVGSIAGALIGFGVGELESKTLEKYVLDKGVIVAVHVDFPKEQLLAKRILKSHGAIKLFDPLEMHTRQNTTQKKQYDSELPET